MNNYALKTDGRSPREVEDKLGKYLPGLDVRLWSYSATQAIIRAHLVRALEIEYPGIGAGPLLKILGIDQIRSITDEETVALLAGRDTGQLPARPRVPAVKVGGLDWHLDLVRAPAAWALLGGPDNIDWGDTSVGHIDTGYTLHPALGFPGPTWIDVARARTFMPPSTGGQDSMFPAETGQGLDNLIGVNAGHGTRMAGTISGYAPDAPGGAFYGVAPKVAYLPIRITDVVVINHAQRQFAQAVNYAIDAVGVKVINVSLGLFLGVVVKEMKTAINKAYDAGVIVVCAAGNHVNSVVAPARLRRTFAVAGVTRLKIPWGGSSYGRQVDLSGPAADLRRANPEKGGKFKYATGGDGTSYATATTSGAAALWLTYRRADIAAAYTQPWQRVAAFTQLARACVFVPPDWQPRSFGTGILDIENLLKSPLPAADKLVKDPPA
jgi:Subtilase family